MGLFSFLSKNKQHRTAQDSGRFSRAEDDAIGERARAKRASHAGEGARRGRDGKGGDDPVLPEKKRARRRLVGAIALALAAIVGLPMLLDSEPKKLNDDIAIQMPAKETAAPLPMPADPGARADAVPAADSVDKGEEIVEPSRAAARTPDPQAVAEVRTAPAQQEAPAATQHVKSPEPEHKARASEAKPVDKPSPHAAKAADKPAAHPQPKEDAARAQSILEGKPAGKAHDSGAKVTLQVAALASQEKAAELLARLHAEGIRAFTEKVSKGGEQLIRVKVGPYSKDEADKVKAKLARFK